VYGFEVKYAECGVSYNKRIEFIGKANINQTIGFIVVGKTE
jgi:hypothetical protein